MSGPAFLAIDLGAESGRAIVGRLSETGVALEEVHRFANEPVRVGSTLHWDVLRLWRDIRHGLGRALAIAGDGLVSVGVDTWGVDYGLLAANDELLGNPIHYRDHRTDGMLDAVFERVPRAEVYARTGIQFMQLNTLVQLFAQARSGSPLLAQAKRLLNMPDLFNFWLSGEQASEFSVATTTQCYDPTSRDWARNMLEALGIPTAPLGPIVPTGTRLGGLRRGLVDEFGGARLAVIASAGHDTAAAVAAVPATGPDFIYLSSGTWSLMGIESVDPIINTQSLAFNATNEGAANGGFRVLKNIMGMWLLQECRREWLANGRMYDYGELAALAEAAPAFRSLIRPSDPVFLHASEPGRTMTGRIQAACRDTGQPVPETPGEVTRCILESLALEYRATAEQLDVLHGSALPVIHIVGGGSRNALLNQLTADATGRTVVAGPVEATALGNVLVQAVATGHLESLAAGRRLVGSASDIATFTPNHRAAWDDAAARLKEYAS